MRPGQSWPAMVTNEAQAGFVVLNYDRKDDATQAALHFTPVKLNAIAL
jgi:hypothetical protein